MVLEVQFSYIKSKITIQKTFCVVVLQKTAGMKFLARISTWNSCDCRSNKHCCNKKLKFFKHNNVPP